MMQAADLTASLAPGISLFRTFSEQHLAVVGCSAAFAILIFKVARHAGPARRRLLGRLLGLGLLGNAAAIYIQQAASHALSWQYSLPLDLCYLIMIACLVALFRPHPRLTEFVYYCGLGGVLQAMGTPDLTAGFPSWDFVLFFWGHGATLLAISFLISDRDFIPGKGAIVRMMMWLNLYAAAVGAINALAGWNYGYLCRKPASSSLLDLLGPWPWYLLALEGVALATFLVLDIPWRLLAWRRRNAAIDT